MKTCKKCGEPVVRKRRSVCDDCYNNCPKYKYSIYKRDARNRKYKWDLTREEFTLLFNGQCHYCGQSPAQGVDRMDNDQGYTPNNAVSCCRKCNNMKSVYTKEELISQCKRILEHNKDK